MIDDPSSLLGRNVWVGHSGWAAWPSCVYSLLCQPLPLLDTRLFTGDWGLGRGRSGSGVSNEGGVQVLVLGVGLPQACPR